MTPHEYKRHPIWTETQTLFSLPSVSRTEVKSLSDIGHCAHFGQWSRMDKWWLAACTKYHVS